MLPVYGSYSMGRIPSGSELLLHPFTLVRDIRAVQIFVLVFRKDGSANLGDKFADGGVNNQPVVLQGHLGVFDQSSCGESGKCSSPVCL